MTETLRPGIASERRDFLTDGNRVGVDDALELVAHIYSSTIYSYAFNAINTLMEARRQTETLLSEEVEPVTCSDPALRINDLLKAEIYPVSDAPRGRRQGWTLDRTTALLIVRNLVVIDDENDTFTLQEPFETVEICDMAWQKAQEQAQQASPHPPAEPNSAF